MEIILWIEEWYKSHCDGDWEHHYGIEIGTIDNPGWKVEIDLKGTSLARLEIEYTLHEISSNDWYGFYIKEMRFLGVGDPNKLSTILSKFKEIVESHKV